MVESVWVNDSDNPELFAVISFPKDVSVTFPYKACKGTLDCILPADIFFVVMMLSTGR